MNTASNVSTNDQSQMHKEGFIAKAMERQTAKLPSDTFLWLAVGSIGTSLALQMMGRKSDSNFVGQWAPTFLILGLYNKLVKVAGSDQQESSGMSHEESFGVAA